MNRKRPLTLAVFVNEIFWSDGQVYSTDAAFIRFVTAFCGYFDRIMLYDRVAPESKREKYVLDPDKITMRPLPWYEDDYALGTRGPVVFPRALRTLAQTADQWDLMWLFAPHPMSLVFAGLCRRRQKPFFLTVRQNLAEQVRHRNRGVKRAVRIAVVRMLERCFMRLAATHPTFTVGDEMYRKYKKGGNPVFPATISLVSAADLRRGAHREGARGGELRLLSVGRLDPEKGLGHLLSAVHALLRDARVGVRLSIVGTGRDEDALKQEVSRLGLDEHVRFMGYVPYGDRLLKIYEESDIFVLSSLTGEGLPQVLLEAMACGVPVVATRVGGIPQLITDGENGLLVAPADAGRLAAAVRRLAGDEAHRRRIVESGFRTAQAHTIEAEVEKMIAVLRNHFPEMGI